MLHNPPAAASLHVTGNSAPPGYSVSCLTTHYLVQQLPHSPMRFQYRVTMVHGSSQIRIRKRDPPKRGSSQNIARRPLAIAPEKKSWLRGKVGMAPPIQNNSRNILLRAKPRGPKHIGELLPDSPFILTERRSDHFAAPAMSLLLGRVPRVGVKNFQCQNDRRIRSYGGLDSAAYRLSAHVKIISNASKPSASGYPHLLQKSPIPHGDIRHHARRPVKLCVSTPLCFRQVFYDVLRRPAPAGHHRRSCLHAKNLSVLGIRDREGAGLCRIAVVPHGNCRRRKPHARRRSARIQRREIHCTSAYSLNAFWSIDRSGKQRLHHQSRDGRISAGEHLHHFARSVIPRVQQIRRILREGRKRIRTQPRATSLDRRKKRADRLAAQSVALHHVLLQRDRIQLARDFITFVFRWIKFRFVGCSARKPSQQFTARSRRKRRSFHLFPDRINEPQPRVLPELCSEPETILPVAQTRRVIRSTAEGHLRSCTGPSLVSQLRRVQSNGIVKACDETVRIGNQIDCRSLMRHEAFSIHLEFVLFRLTAKNRMILQNEARFVLPRFPLEEKRRRQAADSSADNDAVVRLSCLDSVGRQRLVSAVAHFVSNFHHRECIAVRAAVLADAAVPRPIGLRIGR